MSEIELQLRDIWIKQKGNNDLSQLLHFLYKNVSELTWDDWNYICINFQLSETITREFKDYFDLSFIYEWALQSFIYDNNLNFMREFEKEFKWLEKRN